jgi:hypothetical protein
VNKLNWKSLQAGPVEEEEDRNTFNNFIRGRLTVMVPVLSQTVRVGFVVDKVALFTMYCCSLLSGPFHGC